MTNKSPTLLSARPRVSATLQKTDLKQFTPDQIQQLKNLSPDKKKKRGALGSALAQLSGSF